MNMAAEETHVPALDDGQPYDQVEAEQSPVEPDGAGPEVATESEAKTGGTKVYFPDDSELEEYVQREIKRGHRLDPSNPEDLKTIRRMAEQERYIAKLKGGKVDEPAAEEGEEEQATDEESQSEVKLTEFERELLNISDEPKKTEEKQESKVNDKPQPQGQSPNFDHWRDPRDAYQDLTNAWSEAQQAVAEGKPPDFQKINQIESALFGRRLEAMGLPEMMQQVAKHVLQQELGDVIPDVRQSATLNRIASTKEFAIQQLKKTEGYEGIERMFVATDGPPIKIEGDEYPDTPFSRAVAKAPWILDIRKQDPSGDRTKSDRLTMIARIRAAHDVLKTGVTGKAAKKLVEAGAKLAGRAGADPARQGLNSGSGTNSLNPSSGGSGRYAEELLGTEGPLSLADLHS